MCWAVAVGEVLGELDVPGSDVDLDGGGDAEGLCGWTTNALQGRFVRHRGSEMARSYRPAEGLLADVGIGDRIAGKAADPESATAGEAPRDGPTAVVGQGRSGKPRPHGMTR